jgi:hypothetical protein
MSEFKQYRRTAIAEMADWQEGMNLAGVSIGEADRNAGSPKSGDKIARNPKNHADKWLVAAAYFADNFEAAPAPVVPADMVLVPRELKQKMLDAAYELDPPDIRDCKTLREAVDKQNAAFYRAMIAAAGEQA